MPPRPARRPGVVAVRGDLSPLVYRFARRRGLQEADAADVTQDVFRAVARSIRQFDYDRRRDRFAVG